MSNSSLLLNQFYTRIEISLQSDAFIAVVAFQEGVCAVWSLQLNLSDTFYFQMHDELDFASTFRPLSWEEWVQLAFKKYFCSKVCWVCIQCSLTMYSFVL